MLAAQQHPWVWQLVRLLNAWVPKACGVSLASPSELKSQESARTQINLVPDLGSAGEGQADHRAPTSQLSPKTELRVN